MYTPEFRAWLVDDQRMIPNHQITLTSGVVFEHVTETIPPVRRDDAVLMHAAGIPDKHGTPIFPGDRLKWDEAEWGAPFIEVVAWDYQQFSSRANDWPQFVEIVGNIYEK